MTIASIRSGLGRRLGHLGRRVNQALSPRARALAAASANSLATPARLEGLSRVADAILRAGVPGDVVECGVYRGGSAAVLAERLLRRSPGRRMYLFDVFTGMPEPGPEDPPDAWDHVGRYESSPEAVRDTFRLAGLDPARVHIEPGLYERTVARFDPPAAVSLLHLDCDWYEPVLLCLGRFYDAVSPGGAVVFDDFGYWSGCRKAAEEFLSGRGVAATMTPIDETSHYFLKP